MSTSCTIPSQILPSFGPPTEERSTGSRWYTVNTRRVVLGDEELVHVADEPVPRAHLCNGAIRRVVDDVPAVADADVRDLAPPPGEHGLAAVLLDTEIGDAARVQRLEPDDLAAIVHDHRTGLGNDHLRRDEDVAGRSVVRRGPDLHQRRLQIGPRVVGARGRWRRRRLRGRARRLGALLLGVTAAGQQQRHQDECEECPPHAREHTSVSRD